MRKPDPEIYELTLERLGGVPAEQCLFVDDIEVNVEAARELGMTAVHYRDNDQAIAEIRAALALNLPDFRVCKSPSAAALAQRATRRGDWAGDRESGRPDFKHSPFGGARCAYLPMPGDAASAVLRSQCAGRTWAVSDGARSGAGTEDHP